jgi:phosphatidylserine/phosphatidylglycerophosphate/cardiolipin synthase-like enzyme
MRSGAVLMAHHRYDRTTGSEPVTDFLRDVGSPVSIPRALSAVFVLLVATTIISVAPAEASVKTSAVSRVWTEPESGYGFIGAAVKGAQRSIDLSIYELSDPTIENDLVTRAHDGVDVRVILNAAYDGSSENAKAAAVLRAGSVHVVWAPSSQIFHAKYLVIDDTTAYIGTGNFVPSDYSSTRDFWISDTRPTDVTAILATFNGDFARSGATSHQSGGLVWSPGSTQALISLISSAHRTLLVENEEMDSSPVEDALILAARRAVVVNVVMTEDPEWTGALNRLAAAGVHVRLLNASQIYIHAKVVCADCTTTSGTVFIGSENLSTSSLSYNRELGVITSTLAAVRAVRSAVDSDFSAGTPVLATPSTPTTAPVASGRVVTITSVIASIHPGDYESLSAYSPKADDSCSLSVVLPSGYQSESRGLGRSAANAHGNVTWSWKIGTSTDPGSAVATVTCTAGRASRRFTIS